MNILSKSLLLKIDGQVKTIKQISYNSSVLFVVTTDGSLYGSGANDYGQQGSGDTSTVMTLTKRASNVDQVYTSGSTTWYITKDGDLYGCGFNNLGQQGSGDTANVLAFTYRASGVSKVSASYHHTAYLKPNGDLYVCGTNSWGQQGLGETTTKYVSTFTKRASNVKDFYFGYQNVSLYIDTSNRLYGAGYSQYGELATHNSNRLTFQNIANNIKYACCVLGSTWALNTSNELYLTGHRPGSNDAGFIYTSFQKMLDNATEHIVPSGYFTVWCITTNGDLYGCGYNRSGAQGNGTTGDASNFFVKRASNVVRVSASEDSYTVYEDTNGTLYGAGDTMYLGTLYNGTSEKITTFTPLGVSNATLFEGKNSNPIYLDTSRCGYRAERVWTGSAYKGAWVPLL